MMNPIHNGQVLGGRYVVRELLHRGACGDWYSTSPSNVARTRTLPTEFASASAPVARSVTIVVREPAVGELPNLDVAGLTHRFLIEVSLAELMTDDTGRTLFVQVVSNEPRNTLTEMPPAQLASRWRDAVVAVASALAHLHALEIQHGAVRYDNVFCSNSVWRLGPLLCSRQFDRAADLRDLAHLIGVDLRRLINDPQQDILIDRLVDLCLADGGEAAHVAVCACVGYVEPAPQLQGDGILVAPSGNQASERLRLSTGLHGRVAMFCCAPHRLPQLGALIPEAHLDQLGTALIMSTPQEADLAAPRAPIAVFSVVIANGLARIGSHVIIDPLRQWGNLRAAIAPEGLSLQWFWPTDLPCRTMRVQVRPDRFPKARQDPCSIEIECHRSVYEATGQCLIPLQQHWNRAFVRVATDDASVADNEQAAYASAERTRSGPEAMTRRSVRTAMRRA